jgi:hypothetical protein
MSEMNRRTFLLGAGLTMAAGASDRVRVAVVGVRNRGRDLIEEFAMFY